MNTFINVYLKSYPKKMSHEHRKANGQGCRAQASVAPLVCHSKDAHDKLHSEEDLYGCSHTQADARLKLHEWV